MFPYASGVKTMKATSRTDDSPEILFHLRWVAKIALSVGAAAAAGLAAMLYVLTDGSGASYGDLIKSHSVTQHHLGPALLIGGFFLIGFTAVLTWLITLYSSFRIAGPLFRLSQNLEISIAQGPGIPVPIRKSDRLHEEAALLEDALGALASHYDGVREAVDQAIGQIDAGTITAGERRAICARLKERLQRAHI